MERGWWVHNSNTHGKRNCWYHWFNKHPWKNLIFWNFETILVVSNLLEFCAWTSVVHATNQIKRLEFYFSSVTRPLVPTNLQKVYLWSTLTLAKRDCWSNGCRTRNSWFCGKNCVVRRRKKIGFSSAQTRLYFLFCFSQNVGVWKVILVSKQLWTFVSFCLQNFFLRCCSGACFATFKVTVPVRVHNWSLFE